MLLELLKDLGGQALTCVETFRHSRLQFFFRVRPHGRRPNRPRPLNVNHARWETTQGKCQVAHGFANVHD
nr:MAG TPA: putative exosome complex exonuclease 2 [Caudoviricetes sp.]